MIMKQKKFFYKNQQHGGMLLELMLMIAISAILIPFIFRYQQNTVERARNIAVVRQMETVQKSLEQCMSANIAELMQPVTNEYIYTPTNDDSECLFF